VLSALEFIVGDLVCAYSGGWVSGASIKTGGVQNGRFLFCDVNLF
jgi:hypothetical protein